ncbi:hypothetical protein, partial [Hoylesella timonensis]|uniref:hypothetical protein n=1 Tax=Hoylesella timonensis TaxID=386414 RepID=UPI001E46F3D3
VSFCAYSAPLVNYRLPMVLPWAIFLLGLRPVIARNRLLVYNVLECHLAVFAPTLLVAVYRCIMSWSVILLSFSPQLLITSVAGQYLGVLSY